MDVKLVVKCMVLGEKEYHIRFVEDGDVWHVIKNPHLTKYYDEYCDVKVPAPAFRPVAFEYELGGEYANPKYPEIERLWEWFDKNWEAIDPDIHHHLIIPRINEEESVKLNEEVKDRVNEMRRKKEKHERYIGWWYVYHLALLRIRFGGAVITHPVILRQDDASIVRGAPHVNPDIDGYPVIILSESEPFNYSYTHLYTPLSGYLAKAEDGEWVWAKDGDDPIERLRLEVKLLTLTPRRTLRRPHTSFTRYVGAVDEMEEYY